MAGLDGGRRTAVIVLGLGLALAGGCAEDRTLTADQLEQQVERLYPPRDGDTRVRVRCEDGLGASVGARSDCRVRVGRDLALVRATVTDAGEEGPEFDVVPYVPAGQLARQVLDTLLEQDRYAVAQVLCAGDLLGRPGESVTCAVDPPEGGRRTVVEAKVAAVDGLNLRVRYDTVD